MIFKGYENEETRIMRKCWKRIKQWTITPGH